uniref:RRM domain-containing protein n=1 Tax=Chromera velia CCMP2878 TaxID=1169474 RepID=A0A0G4I0E1_9ALVE|eukprot:Cvel_9925.t1-p1 / transcript=Cvel_9925.t1 / gene=Cvel_9925 / organism=Chromera_velia_CCMP2878 / gene_product=Uncharacterized RNA-binding protein C365.04c, putative / transcript_product=Uncharacterized RNA-binding protein C365.04c, putative / location=Cvel_scaffold586:48634-51429(-) / protein_length=187 / sequence_SO=supercontig / SO=protein_coding / is_pseudo=false
MPDLKQKSVAQTDATKVKGGQNAPKRKAGSPEQEAPRKSPSGGKGKESVPPKGKGQPKRFICFMGAVPKSANKEDISKFFKFAGENLVSVRILTEKGTNKPRGCAFVEFKDSSSLAKALKMSGQTLMGKKVRIEPTVGGGGKGGKRQERLQKKKEKTLKDTKKAVTKWKGEKEKEKVKQTEKNVGGS